ncbi:MAG: NAD(P)/FAD-dependent oxidoreductase [Candidatus Thermoplasmatota archaeon]|nr:NAD(P)/FAD-dependent oxidoreductase [Candidatus Thermoplasmatota archaeon]
MNKKKVCIIGAGIGGLTAGALLLQKGYSVDIFEKEPMVGGRALSIDMSSHTIDSYKQLLARFNTCIVFSEPTLEDIFKNKMLDGYTLDLGFHMIGGGIIQKLRNMIMEQYQNITIYESRLFEQKNSHFGYFVTTADKISMLPNILRLLLAGEKKMKEFDDVTITETIKKYGKGKMKDVLELNPRLISTINNLGLISTGEVFRTQKDMRLRGVNYPKNGLLTISQTIAGYIEKNGGKIHVNSPVTKIIIRDKKAEGVIVNEEEFSFDVILSNIVVQKLFTIADESQFPGEYVTAMKTYEGTASLCAYYAFKQMNPQLLGKSFVFIARNIGVDGNDAAGMIDFITAKPETGLSPASEYLVQAYIICTPKEARDRTILDKLKKALDKNLQRIIPDFQSQLKWAIYPATWHLDGVAKTIHHLKPDIQTPVENLYVIGDCVKAPGIGINCAINSAQIIQKILP